MRLHLAQQLFRFLIACLLSDHDQGTAVQLIGAGRKRSWCCLTKVARQEIEAATASPQNCRPAIGPRRALRRSTCGNAETQGRRVSRVQ